MSRNSCDRSWQAEAARDGRLDAAERTSFEQHVKGCDTCQDERRALDALALGLKELGGELDEMALRRMRQQTLEKANGALMQSQRPGRARTVVWTALACGALTAAVLLLVRPGAPSEEARVAAVRVFPEQDAVWRRDLQQDVEHVDLSAGTLLFQVARKPSDPRLIVRVPDGEIEDLGTVFSVSVQDGKTREIQVREGRVLFHRRGASALHLVAGSRWTPPEESAPVEAVPQPPESAAPLKVEEPAPAVEKPKPAARRRVEASAPVPAAAQETPNEDAAYLQMLALLREGRVDEARLAAFAYLKAFPTGFRRVEVGRVAARAGHSPQSAPLRKPDEPNEPSE